ncbi:hypothetical protein CASFOL_038277 [Castilleja foliolosa]|uniref:Uncharacterized protein n=1 Tax=Castilleja foliolosa TaxID=1961234 RepID=A0ABD3BLF4_9LAMI
MISVKLGSYYVIPMSKVAKISSLLRQCLYQVSAVWSERDVFGTLDSEGPRAHIILVEVNLLMANDARVLRHIVREKQLQRTPVINEVSVTAGADLVSADRVHGNPSYPPLGDGKGVETRSSRLSYEASAG